MVNKELSYALCIEHSVFYENWELFKEMLQFQESGKPMFGWKCFYTAKAIVVFKPGWRSGYRASLEIQVCTTGACAKSDKPASGPLARRGSNPFPGANLSSMRG